MKTTALIGLLLGLAGGIGLIVHFGAAEIAEIVISAGWALAAVCAFHLVPVFATALSWRSLLLARGTAPALWRITWMRWVCDSVNSLLPVAQIGGEVVRGRLLTRTGVSGSAAGASVVVDVTAGLVSLVAYIALGLALLLAREAHADWLWALAAGGATLAVLLAAFVAIQRSTVFVRLGRRLEDASSNAAWRRLTGGAAAVHQEIAALYERPGPFLRCTAWRFFGWLGGGIEIWLALLLMGQPVGLAEALILETVVQAVRNIGFAVPGALGIQEGGMVAAGLLVGVSPETALALALIKRARDVVLGVPGLISWQAAEGRVLWRRHARTRSSSATR